MSYLLIALTAVSSSFHVELSKKQTECIATAIYHEARGEPVMGQAAVAYVINNRVHSKRYPSTACAVVYQKHQFTNVQHAKPNKKSKAWRTATEIAAYSQVGLIDDETGGATMYYNPDKASPRWAWEKLAYIGSLQGHKFFREIR